MTAPDRMLTKGGYCDEDRARVLALRALHFGYDTIAEKTGVPKSTVRDWIHRYQDVISDDPELMNEEVRIAKRGQALLHDYLEAVENADTATLLKHGLTLNAITGTALDKVHNQGPRPLSNPTLVIVIPGIDEIRTIDGEVSQPSS